MMHFNLAPAIGIDQWTFQSQVAQLWPTHTAETLTASGNAGEHATILCDCTSGAITVTLPPVLNLQGMHYWIKKTDAGGNAVTVDGSGRETIDGATTVSLPNQYDSVHIYCDGSVWWKI